MNGSLNLISDESLIECLTNRGYQVGKSRRTNVTATELRKISQDYLKKLCLDFNLRTQVDVESVILKALRTGLSHDFNNGDKFMNKKGIFDSLDRRGILDEQFTTPEAGGVSIPLKLRDLSRKHDSVRYWIASVEQGEIALIDGMIECIDTLINESRSKQ